jgi:hypothetical protein
VQPQVPQAQPGQPAQPAAPGQQPGAQAQAPEAAPSAAGTEAFAQAPSGGTPSGGSFNPAMFGDQPGPSFQHSSSANAGVAPVVARGSFKVAENESPRPVDRVFFSYNFYDDLNLGGAGTATLHRETVGFEKTFLEGNASIEVRLPFVQLEGSDLVNASGVGDLTVLTKYAFINDRDTGDVFSAGLAVTAPTGGHDEAGFIGLPIRDWLIQPYFGYILNLDDLYIHGFESIVIPTDSRDATIVFTDIGLGYWVYRNRERDARLTGVVPTLEMHVTTPLTHRGLSSATADNVGVPDWLTFTAGAHIYCGRTEVGLAVATPVTGPRPFDLEALASINFHF